MKRKGSSRKKSELDTKLSPKQPNIAKCQANARTEVERWVRRALDKGVGGLREEFLSLKRYIPEGMTTNAFQGTFEAGKSRYKDVPCQDKFRVVLRWPGVTDDYIHANYVATPINEKRFICTQVRALAPDETNVRVCHLKVQWKESGREKNREIRHYQWINWPDRGVPPCRLTSMVLLSNIRGTKKPIVVHCSAGIGRTGAIVAIEYILEKLQQGIPCESMDKILKELRNQRPFTIQNDLQYLYVHRVMLFYFIDKYKIFADNDEVMAKYKQFVADYDKITK
ncbi:Uncharacterized protein BM_BM2282 [Brugia malayi]|uniref:Protein-tyrosine phosphatase containing protein n=1 Tax=Brugia malayi TaxID=6279 RepID=A0A4E9FJW2_BRUMA|nr:Uncharacterized protein BM_BM2282 [Brugia malayi]VIO95758.1 Uncharacterized protein BM_BM2282 [Brugia malayi]